MRIAGNELLFITALPVEEPGRLPGSCLPHFVLLSSLLTNLPGPCSSVLALEHFPLELGAWTASFSQFDSQLLRRAAWDHPVFLKALTVLGITGHRAWPGGCAEAQSYMGALKAYK